MRTAGILEGEPNLAFGEVGGVGATAFGARGHEEFVLDFVTDRFGCELVGVLVAHRRAACLLYPDVEGGL